MSNFTQSIMTGDNLPQGNYLPLDLNLINNPKYSELSIEAMVLHSLYTMRMSCSIYNSQKDGSWLDEVGLPFIYFSNDEAAALLRVSERKITTLRNSLIQADLIKVIRHGLKNYRIYVANPAAPKQNEPVVLAFKNYVTTKEKLIQPVDNSEKTAQLDLSTAAKSADTSSQNLLTSTEKQLAQAKPNTTSETQKIDSTDKSQAALIAGLQARYAHLLPKQVFSRFLPFCNGDYQTAKGFVDTIFKAKFASNQLFMQAGLPAEVEALTFEQNPYYGDHLSDAIAKAFEQMYRYGTGHVKKPEAFFFAFMKGYFTEQTRRYLTDFYEMTPQLDQVLSVIQQSFATSSAKKLMKSKKIA